MGYGTVRVKKNEHNAEFANADGYVDEVFELLDLIRDTVMGKEKFARVGIRRVGYLLNGIFYQFEDTLTESDALIDQQKRQ